MSRTDLPQGPWDLWGIVRRRSDGTQVYSRIGDAHWTEVCQAVFRQSPAVPVRVTEDPEGPYWGWLDPRRPYPVAIWATRMGFRAVFNGEPEQHLAGEIRRGNPAAIVRLRVEPR